MAHGRRPRLTLAATAAGRQSDRPVLHPLCVPLLCLLLAWLPGCVEDELAASDAPATQSVRLNGHTFELELALTPDQRYQGLSDREHIPPNGGMLFVFPKAQHRTFVMRRCLVPIDIIFLDSGGRIVAMHEMKVEPYDRSDFLLTGYRSREPAQFAIELAGGTLDKLTLRRGQVVDLPRKELVQQAR